MALLDQGEEDILDIIYRGASPPASLYVGIVTASAGETATLATVTEVSGGSYARVALPRSTTGFPALALDSGDFRAESQTITFPAPTAHWAPVGTEADGLIVCTVASGTGGRLWHYIPFAAPITILNGDPAPTFKIRVKAQ